MDHGRAFREVADPQGVAVVASPATADLLRFADPQLLPCHSLLTEVTIHGRRGNRAAELLGQELVDREWRAVRLFTFQFDGAGDHRLPFFARLSSILAATTSQSGDLLLAISLYLPPQRGIGDPFPPTVGQRYFLPAQLLEVPSALPCGDFVQQDRTEQRTPEHGPVIIGMIHFF
ncbi:MAG: hypothetical protein ACC628_20690 [Pirellulaceae bacterium]